MLRRPQRLFKRLSEGLYHRPLYHLCCIFLELQSLGYARQRQQLMKFFQSPTLTAWLVHEFRPQPLVAEQEVLLIYDSP